MSNEASEYNELLDIVSDIVDARHLDQEGLARLRAHLGYKPAALATQRQAEPVDDGDSSAGNRTHIADLIDTFEQLRKIVGTPEQDADALIAAVRALAAPPSAQQATGSGQVLSDQLVAALSHANGILKRVRVDLLLDDRGVHPDLIKAINKADAALAAAAQAQPEAHRIKVWGPCSVCRHDRIPGEGCARAECPDAAPTTGKREPLSDEQRTELARSFTGRNVPAIASPELWFQRGISAAERVINAALTWEAGPFSSPLPGACIELRDAVVAYKNAHGITGEQR